MARRNRGGAPVVSLFPFLSILACVIGVLTLIITALALSQLDPAEVERVEAELREQKQRSDQYQQILADRAALEGAIAPLRSQLASMRQQEARLTELREQAKRLQDQRDRLAQQNSEAADMLAKVDQLSKQLAQAKAAQDAMQQRVDQTQAELADRKTPPAPARVVVQPSGTGRNLKPTFVECEAKGIVIHSGDTPVHVPRGKVAEDDRYLALLDRIADAERQTIVFLLRKDGVSTYYLARRIALQRYARNGKLPVTADGAIDLSLFDP